MASAAFDLNRWDASASLIRSAEGYAIAAGHSSLEAWCHGFAGLLANWRNEPDTALARLQRGLQTAPRSTPKVRLYFIAARSYALLGDGASAVDVLGQAAREQDQGDQHPDPLSGQAGGEFAFSRARAAACAAAVWLDLRHGARAQAAARQALAELTALPPARQPVSQINGARADLASACLLERDLDGAIAAIDPVLAQPPAARNVPVTGRMARISTTLSKSPWAEDTQARQLGDQVACWMAHSS